jgi:hypothetical protein
VATVENSAPAQSNATQWLTSNANEIAAFLSKANPHLPKATLGSLLLAHGGHHIQQIQQLKNRNYEAEAQTWKEMKDHVYQIADATTDALANSLPASSDLITTVDAHRHHSGAAEAKGCDGVYLRRPV